MRRLLPSMFHRRLVLIAIVAILAFVPLVGQMARLTLAQGVALRAEAENKLARTTWLPTRRGRILDRHGRWLATDRPSYDIAAPYPVITGEWAIQRAGRFARQVHRDTWPKLSAEQRDALIAEYLPAYQRHLDDAWLTLAEVSGITPERLETRRQRVIESVERMFSSVVERRRDRARAEEIARGREITAEIERRIDDLAERPIREQEGLHALAPRVPDETSFAFQRLAADQVELRPDGIDGPVDLVERIPGLSVIDASDRLYPLDAQSHIFNRTTFPGPLRSDIGLSVNVEGVGAHVIGWLTSEPKAEDVERRAAALEEDPELAARVRTPGGVDRGRYRPGDVVGRFGVERSREDTLRGLRGLNTQRLDTGDVVTLDPVSGRDVHLTLDIALQGRIQAIMSPELGLARIQAFQLGRDGVENPIMPIGTPLNGAAVVMDIDSAEILAMVSTPTPSRTTLAEDPNSLFQDELNNPTINRCVGVPYQPGSIVKPLMVCAARALGALDAGERIECTGHFLENRTDVYRCWIYKRFGITHQSETGFGLAASEAIKVSCNIFFYELGQRLGADGVRATFEWFGLGQTFGFGVGPETPGFIGDARTGRLDPSDQAFMGIGQGPVAWTPMHAAEALATLARAGVRQRPRLIKGAETDDPVELDIPRDAIDAALEGLRLSVNDPDGTGHHITLPDGTREPIFNLPYVDLWGKTGTAEASPLLADLDGDGVKERAREGDHSWFAVLVAPEGERPRYVVVVVMEYAGSGGRVSGPIANQILHALRAEGYLP